MIKSLPVIGCAVLVVLAGCGKERQYKPVEQTCIANPDKAAVMQAAQFVVALLGLRYLYVPTSSMAGHLYLYSEQWFFTLPWMALNGAFGGYTAYALRKRV
jgi:hypothetical protein